jgi:hypothetical protein
MPSQISKDITQRQHLILDSKSEVTEKNTDETSKEEDDKI